MDTTELDKLEARIISLCAEHEKQHGWDCDYHRCVPIGSKFFVKYGCPTDVGPEANTQSYIYNYAICDENAPRIPKVIHYFLDESKVDAFLIMEYIELDASPTAQLPERAAAALDWLSNVLPPSEDTLGPVGGGLIRHMFFKNDEAPLRFTSIRALESYMNKGLNLLPDLDCFEKLKQITIAGERRIFTQSDMDSSNFGIDKQGRTVLFDFAQIMLLPESFACYTMTSTRMARFIADVTKSSKLNWSKNPNITSMGRVRRCLWVVGDPTLGLNEDGQPARAET